MKIGIVSYHTENLQPLADYTWPNKVEYAERHGYDHFCKVTPLGSMQPAGGKIPAIKDYIDTHTDIDWVWWVDTDTLITNFNIKVEEQLDKNYDFIISTDGNGINSGSFFLRNNDNGRAFIDHLLNVYNDFENRYGMLGEQESIAQSYNMPEWKPDKLGERGWWEPGDFLVHWPGSSLETRLSRQIPHYQPLIIK
jgi:hypothetical protein